MEEDRITISSTHKDLHGDSITREQLESIAKSMNGDSHKPAINIEHDLTLPPLGRCVRAIVEQGDDGEFYLTVEREYFDKSETIILKNGEKLIKESFSGVQFPLRIGKDKKAPDDLRISIDEHCFESKEAAQSFFQELDAECAMKYERGYYMRKSQIPDPIVIFELTEKIVAYILVYKLASKFTEGVAEKVGEKVGEELNKFYDIVKKAVTKMTKYVLTKKRPIVYIFVINEDIKREYIIKTDKPNIVAEAFSKDKLIIAENSMIDLKKIFNIKIIQFLYNENNGWEFNYLLTNKGESVGTPLALTRRDNAMRMLYNRLNSDMSLEGNVRNNNSND